MALIQCPECGQQISDKANVCPNCGCPISNQQQGNTPIKRMQMLDFGNAIFDCFTKKYTDFKGRSRRSEYFPFLLVVAFVYGYFSSFYDVILTPIITIVLVIPFLAVTARRLHDVGRSGWWMLCPILPFFWMFKDSDVGTNQWGVSPKYPD